MDGGASRVGGFPTPALSRQCQLPEGVGAFGGCQQRIVAILKFLSKDSSYRYVSVAHMKPISTIIALGAAGTLGYLAEPHLRLQLTGKSSTPSTPASAIQQRADGALEINLEALSAEQLPKQVLLHTAAKVSDPATGLTRSIDAGNRVKPVRIEVPNAGRILQVHCVTGQFVQSGDPLWTVADWSTLWLRVPVFDGDAQRIDSSQPAQIPDRGSPTLTIATRVTVPTEMKNRVSTGTRVPPITAAPHATSSLCVTSASMSGSPASLTRTRYTPYTLRISSP